MASDGEQVDLFLESIINAPVKDERALMEFPFFSLQKQKRVKPFIYDDGAVRIEVSAGAGGIATIWDKDVLIYLTSLINGRIERGEPVSRTMHFAAYDFLRLTGRGTGKAAYEGCMSALDRLQSTTIRTTITSGHNEERERRGFSWIDSYRVIERTTTSGRKIMAAVEVTLNKWMFRAIVEDRRVLTIDRAYFRLQMGLERRLYELARKHCGRQKHWTVSLPRLAEKCGSEQELRNFKVYLKKIIDRDSLPQYRMTLSFDGNGPGREIAEQLGGDTWRWGGNERILVSFSHKTAELLLPMRGPAVIDEYIEPDEDGERSIRLAPDDAELPIEAEQRTMREILDAQAARADEEGPDILEEGPDEIVDDGSAAD
ncbi:replication initiator protein A [Magnetospirillum sp. XM-1]|uniref:replication initiator protein A n=1 Tax=Magnetospirillum sp. XM-1 TaxID=1663591 RepID=UPI0009E7AE95|nr:replication initiator protein A [Magnetospirillum sp. XM-1]